MKIISCADGRPIAAAASITWRTRHKFFYVVGKAEIFATMLAVRLTGLLASRTRKQRTQACIIAGRAAAAKSTMGRSIMAFRDVEFQVSLASPLRRRA